MALFNETIALLITANTGGATSALKKLEGQSTQTATAWDKAGKKIGVSGTQLTAGLAAAGTAVATYVQVVGGILDVTSQFAEAAKSAGDLAAATGGTVEEVSAMQAALTDAGVSAEKSAGMLTKFTTAAGTKKGADTLRALNVEMVRGQSGAVDYAASMTVAVDQIMALGDAAQRNAAFVALFGRQGAAAFQDMLASGVSLSEAIKAVDSGRIFTSKDYQNAQRYDAAIDAMNASMEDLKNTVGRSFLPAITDAAQGVQALLDLATKVPIIPQAITAFMGFLGPLALLGKLFGDDAEAAADLADTTTETTTSMQDLTALIASGATSGEAFANAVAAAGDELATQDANARLAAQALDIYRASTDQAYESTLKLLDLNRSEKSAQRAAEGAADTAADAKANMDKAVADAKAAKTVVEHIAAIRGRERKKEQSEGIIPGSTDVREIPGVKGRKASTKTRVTEAAGVITPAEARAIREATRTYEDSLDDVAAAWERLGQERVKHKEALGLTLTEAEKLDEVRKALKEGLKSPGLSPKAKDAIKADLKVVEEQIKKLGGIPIEIHGIKFKGGTTKADIDSLNKQIAAALDAGNAPLAHELQSRIDALVVKGPTDLTATLGLDPKSVADTKAALADVGIDPKTGKPYNTKTTATADTSKAKTALDDLTKPRTVTVTVDVVPGTDGFGGNSPLTPPVPGARNRINFGTAQQVSFSPQVTVNYPKPERASDSIASALRTAKYMVGV